MRHTHTYTPTHTREIHFFHCRPFLQSDFFQNSVRISINQLQQRHQIDADCD